MKLILEFRSMDEMRAFCREQVGQEAVSPQREIPSNGSSDTPVLEVPEDQEPLTGLGKRQVAVLRALADGEHRPTRWISEEIGIAVPALSTTLTSLAKRGLVCRVKWGTWAKAEGVPVEMEEVEPYRKHVVQQYQERGMAKGEDRKGPYYSGYIMGFKYTKDGDVIFTIMSQQRPYPVSINPKKGRLLYLGKMRKRPNWKSDFEQDVAEMTAA